MSAIIQRTGRRKPDENQVIATTLLQARLLTQAGLPDSTADMRWNKNVTMFGRPLLEPFRSSDPIVTYHGVPEHPADYVPAWSLGRLLQISGVVPNIPERPDLIIAGLVNYICEQLENGGGNNQQSESID